MLFGSKKQATSTTTPKSGPATKEAMEEAAAAASATSGVGDKVDELTPEEAQRRAAIAIRQSLAFAQIVSVLMRSPHHKHYTLSDLEWLVLPPLLTGQFSVAEANAKKGGPRVPVAVALWASVSAEVDKRLSENLTSPIRLRPDEWRSGGILWLVDAVGDGRVIASILKKLGETVWKGREVKVRRRAQDGKLAVGNLVLDRTNR
jgi:hemolysin-activating ACP:hemolysin acyltransferase